MPEFVDVGILGEGEETLLELLNSYSAGRFNSLSEIKGIVYRDNGQIKVNPKRPFIENIDTIPHPDVQLLKVNWSKRTVEYVYFQGLPLQMQVLRVIALLGQDEVAFR